MGNVLKRTVTRQLSPTAWIVTRQEVRIGRWRDAKGGGLISMRSSPRESDAGELSAESGTRGRREPIGRRLGTSAVSTNKKGTPTFPVSVPSRAGEEIRTPDVQLGKLAFYH